MRIVPCRVVCYYKFNVKSGWQKMRVVEEGGEAQHLKWKHSSSFSVGQQMCSMERKSKMRQADLKEEKSFHSRPHSEAYFTPWLGASCLS